MILRPYQVNAVSGVLGSWASGHKLPCLVSPTGSGKTEMALETMRRKLAEVGGQGLVLTHTRVLHRQAVRRFKCMTCGTVQGLLAKGKAGDRRRAALSRYRVVCIDEAHHIVSKTWHEVVPMLEGKFVFGPTATPERGDGTPLGDVCDDMIVAANYRELLEQGYLCPCDVQRSEMSRKEQKSQKKRVDGVAAYLEHGRVHPSDPRYVAGLRWRPGIYFDGTVEQCAIAVQRFKDAGIRAELITFRTSDRERQRIFDAYTRGELDMLAAPMALSEGFDSPRAEVCVLRRMANAVGTYLQIVGRVLRPYPGKVRALLIDCSGASEASCHWLPTVNRTYSLQGKGIQLEQPPNEEGDEDEEEIAPAPVERRQYEDIQVRYQLVRDTLLARYDELAAEAERKGWRPGSLWHRMRESTGLDIPRRLSLPVETACTGCGELMPRGLEVFWPVARTYYHARCWFRSLDAPELGPLLAPPSVAQQPAQFIDHAYDWVDELR